MLVKKCQIFLIVQFVLFMFPDGKIDFHIFFMFSRISRFVFQKVALEFRKSSNQVLGLNGGCWASMGPLGPPVGRRVSSRLVDAVGPWGRMEPQGEVNHS